MKRSILSIKAGIAVSVMALANPAYAQEPELDPAAVAAATRFSLPLVFDGYLRRCSSVLEEDGYSLSNAPRLREKFADGAELAWPEARELMLKLAEEEQEGTSEVLDLLDDATLQTLVTGIVGTLAENEIRLQDCDSIERGLEILDPLPADNLGALVGFIVELGIAMEKEEEAAIGLPPDYPEMTESRRRKLREQEEEARQR